MSGEWPEELFTKKKTLDKVGLDYIKTILEQMIATSGMTAEQAIFELAMIATLRRRYFNARPPVLTLGTIVQVVFPENEGQPNQESAEMRTGFWICLQPQCDSVRIPPSGRAFPFLPLEVVPNEKQDAKFNLVVPGMGDEPPVRLKLSQSLYECRMILLSPLEGDGVIRATTGETEGFFFKSDSVPQATIRWVAELKFEQAQRVADVFSGQIGRVGLNESEWLRKAAKPGG